MKTEALVAILSAAYVAVFVIGFLLGRISGLKRGMEALENVRLAVAADTQTLRQILNGIRQ